MARADDAKRALPVEPVPDWTIGETIPEPNSARLGAVQDGIYVLISDLQVRTDGKTNQYYLRAVNQPISRAGLEGAARLEFHFDPTQDELILHYVHVHRGGVVQDRTKDLLFTTARQELDLKNGITDGELTAFAELTDIRVDDKIDYAVSWRVKPKLWPGHLFQTVQQEWTVPVGFYRQRLLVPETMELTRVSVAGATPAQIQTLGSYTEYSWSGWDPEPKMPEQFMPGGHPLWAALTVSSMHSWGEVVKWALPIYAVAPAKMRKAEKIAATIKAEYNTDADRLTEAIRQVQDNIRYVGIEIGMGSHVPRAPDTTLELGYGDCKDKSLLLVAILRNMGYTAYPSLTHIQAGGALPLEAPAPTAFNHVIVQVVVGGETKWIDATASSQGGRFPQISIPNYGYALPISAETTDLVKIAQSAPEEPTYESTESFDMVDLEGQGVALTVTSVYRGLEADGMRANIEWNSIDGLANAYFQYYEKLYPGLVAEGGMGMADDRDANMLTLTATYRLPFDAYTRKDFQKAFPFRAEAVTGILPLTSGEKRQTPVATTFPVFRTHRIEVKNAGFRLRPTGDYSKTSPLLTYRIMSEATDDNLQIVYTLKPLTDKVELEQLADYQDLVRTIQLTSYFEYDFKKRRIKKYLKR